MDSQEMTLGQERTEEQLNVTPGDNGTVENINTTPADMAEADEGCSPTSSMAMI